MTTRVIISVPHVSTGKVAVVRSIDRRTEGEPATTELHRTAAPGVFEVTIWDGRSFDVYEDDAELPQPEPVADEAAGE